MSSCCPVLELRQYTLHPGQRDVLIELFERELIEDQEAHGMRIVGQFRDLDDPDRFVWIRGFSDMTSRREGLAAFYGGSTWKAQRDAANATMIDSSNVLLLRPVRANSGFSAPRSARPPIGGRDRRSSLVLATIVFLDPPADDAFRGFFERDVIPLFVEAGASTIASFETEPAENTFPALPVRTAEHVFVWFASFSSIERYREYERRLAGSTRWNEQVLPVLIADAKQPIERLRLEPTGRSLLG
jgi:hypothetical protein